MSLTTSRTLSRFAWSLVAVFGSTALLLAPQLSFADNAAPAAPAAPAPAAPAKKPAKKMAMPKKHPAKPRYKGLSFAGTVVATDLSASPQTIVVSRGRGKKEIVFGGALTAHTAVVKGRKHVRPSAIKTGEKVVVHYKRAMGTLIVTGIWIR